MSLSHERFQADCINWRGNKPCPIQKMENRPDCLSCSQYEQGETLYDVNNQPLGPESITTADNIGIVEMGGLGSLMRTTAVSRAIRKINPIADITWFTHSRGTDLLQYVPGVMPVDIERFNTAQQERIASKQDIIINFELSNLAENIMLRARRIGGFAINRQGKFVSANSDAEYFQRFQIDDSFRLLNQLKMQQILLKSIGLGDHDGQYDIALPDERYQYADTILAQMFENNIPREVIGLNIGTSNNGRVRRWPAEHYAALAKQLVIRYPDKGVVVLYGPEDDEVREKLTKSTKEFINSHLVFLPDNIEIGCFIALVSKLDVLVTSNSFALHAAKSQNVPIVTFDNPLPPQEIEIEDADILITPGLKCGPCFNRCTQAIEGMCMHEVSVTEVALGIDHILNIHHKS